MIIPELLDRFLAGVKGQALREGTRYAREARVGDFAGSAESVSSLVRGRTGDYDVALWADSDELQHRCSCPSWRDPCKHEVAAALVLRQCVTDEQRGRTPRARPRTGRVTGLPASPPEPAQPGPAQARPRAIEERRVAARREKLVVKPDVSPFLRVDSPSGFAYRVLLRGDAEGPHSCECPDFEANRLHTCKHVERVRAYLRSPRSRLPREHRRDAVRPRVYLHFGEVVEPRLSGRPRGRGALAVRRAFDGEGIPYRPLARDEAELRHWLGRFGDWVEPHALEWLDRRLERRPDLPTGDLARLLPPLGLEPYAYQWDGVAFLARTGRALLADEMGLGKTGQAILAAAALRHASRPARGVTVVCPASLRGGWQEEVHRWLGEDTVLLEGPAPARARTIASRPRWLVTHYEQVIRDHRHHQAHPPDLLIIDEAQRAKGLWTRTARILKSIRARYLFALTGTPLENRLEEAYSIAQLIDQRLLPPLWQLDRDHFVRDEKQRRVVLYRGLGALRSRLAPAFLRRRKEDVALDLPERLRSTAMLPMHEGVVETYEDVLAQVARIAGKKVLLPADLERIQRLLVIARRCCNGPHMLGLDVDDRKVPKLQELEQLLRDLCLGEGRKAVVFSEWTDMTERVEALCRKLGLPVFHLHGGVPVGRRPALLRAFAGQKESAVFVSTDAGSLGLNLQAADVVINMDLPWNPARLEQRMARVHRIGSRRAIQELLLITKESIEERILHLHATKRNVLANVWDRGAEDVIAAPGGSGAFREMVAALLRTRGPEAPVPVAEVEDVSRAGVEPARAGEEKAAAPITIPELPPVPGPGEGPALSRVAALSPVPAAAGPSAAEAEADAETQAVPCIVDPAAISAAVAAIAPMLPPEHRRSLAVVFRALAESLEVR
jgi:superfamily II DNA or RNA helicase